MRVFVYTAVVLNAAYNIYLGAKRVCFEASDLAIAGCER